MAEHKAAARSVVVGVPGVMFWAVVLLVKWQGAPLRIIVARWACSSKGWQTLRCSWVVLVYSGGSVVGGCCCGGTW